MLKEKTRYGWLRFVSALQDIAGCIMLGLGGIMVVAGIIEARRGGKLDPTLFPVFLGLILGGLVMFGVGQAIRALADIADNSRYLPLILERLPRRDSVADVERLPDPPELGSTVTLGRPCPKCGTQVYPTRPVCSQCGTRVPFSRPL